VIDPVLRIDSNRAIFPGPIRPPDTRSMRIETWVSTIGKLPNCGFLVWTNPNLDSADSRRDRLCGGRSGRGNGVHRGSGPRWLWSRHHSTRCADIERARVRHWRGAIRTGRAAKLAELFSLRLARGSVLYPWWHHPSACVHLSPCRRCPSTAGGLADGPIRTTNNRRQPSIAQPPSLLRC
jgi:hypothetical protein